MLINSLDNLFQWENKGIWGKLNSNSVYLLHLATIAFQKQKSSKKKTSSETKFRFPPKYNKIKVGMSKKILFKVFLC